MKKTNKITVFTFVGFIAVFFLLLIVMPKTEFSEMENRNLAQMPQFTFERLFNGKFTSEFEEYVTDQFAFRDTWVGMKYFFEKALLKTENNGIYFADDGYLMTKFVTPDEGRLNINYGAVDKLAESLDIPVRFSLMSTLTSYQATQIHIISRFSLTERLKWTNISTLARLFFPTTTNISITAQIITGQASARFMEQMPFWNPWAMIG